MALTKVTNDLLTLDAAQPSITSVGTLTNFTSTGIDDNATSTAITITSDEKVGINLANPSAYYADFSNLVLGNTSANSGMTIVSSTSNSGTIAFSDGTSGSEAYRGYIQYDHGADTLAFGSLATQRMVIDASGRVTMPHQPAFCVRNSSLQSNIPINTLTTIAFGTEIFDVGGNFASNTFTAPVTGKYQLNVEVRLDNMDTAATYYHLHLKTSNRSFTSIIDAGGLSSDPAYWSMSVSALADMDANDTVSVAIYQAIGTAQTDINADNGNTIFSGYLAC